MKTESGSPHPRDGSSDTDSDSEWVEEDALTLVQLPVDPAELSPQALAHFKLLGLHTDRPVLQVSALTVVFLLQVEVSFCY